ncbi:hypothetical protein NUW54_g11369 [Trametes sanguinea]|uniref:Uncharacterized protein n=1 Tax=Trametes sanguinea TaxID=158606 RepID=A0ACC1NG58_9APHY|nr:hypothetical protein NUW54_g11369 [Trametes sanguinea]
MFFGTITHVEEAIRALLDDLVWRRNPIRFLVLDLALVAGVDMSAAEAFVRVQRLLAGKKVVLVLCGFTVDSSVGRALNNVGLLEMDGVELFETFSDAVEWTENTYLRAWFRAQKAETLPVALPGRQDDVIPFPGSVVDSPRRAALLDAGWRTIARDHSPPGSHDAPEPFNTLVRAFSSYESIDRETYAPLIPYLKRMSVPAGTALWHQGDAPDGLYIVESGILRATYRFADPTPPWWSLWCPGRSPEEPMLLPALEPAPPVKLRSQPSRNGLRKKASQVFEFSKASVASLRSAALGVTSPSSPAVPPVPPIPPMTSSSPLPSATTHGVELTREMTRHPHSEESGGLASSALKSLKKMRSRSQLGLSPVTVEVRGGRSMRVDEDKQGPDAE